MANKHKLVANKKTLNTISKLASLQCTNVDMAAFLGVCEKTFQTFKKENEKVNEAIEIGKGKGRISLRRKQSKLADKNASMAIWLGKQYLGQKDEVLIEHGGQVGIDAKQSLIEKLLSGSTIITTTENTGKSDEG